MFDNTFDKFWHALPERVVSLDNSSLDGLLPAGRRPDGTFEVHLAFPAVRGIEIANELQGHLDRIFLRPDNSNLMLYYQAHFDHDISPEEGGMPIFFERVEDRERCIAIRIWGNSNQWQEIAQRVSLASEILSKYDAHELHKRPVDLETPVSDRPPETGQNWWNGLRKKFAGKPVGGEYGSMRVMDLGDAFLCSWSGRDYIIGEANFDQHRRRLRVEQIDNHTLLTVPKSAFYDFALNGDTFLDFVRTFVFPRR